MVRWTGLSINLTKKKSTCAALLKYKDKKKGEEYKDVIRAEFELASSSQLPNKIRILHIQEK